MSAFDIKVPHSLKQRQLWFCGVIGQPIGVDNRISAKAPSGQSIELEAAEYILPSPSLAPFKRIEIYNQQYWWRLLKTLQDAFITLTHYFGINEFNRQIAVPFLVKHPPNTWLLNNIGERLPQWIKERYPGKDRLLICQMAEVDLAFILGFTASAMPPLSSEDMADGEAILSTKLQLQPHIYLFESKGDIFKLREAHHHLKTDNKPKKGRVKYDERRTFYYILYRNQQSDISWKEISKAEYSVLSHFKKGASVEDICEWLEGQNEALCEAAMTHFQSWFQEWTSRGWLCK